MKYLENGYDVYNLGECTKSLHGIINSISRITGVPFDEHKDVPLEWFNENLKELKDDRIRKLFYELRPIKWRWDSPIGSRQNLVASRYKAVNAMLPFLTDVEMKLVAQWKKENNGAGLWD